MTVNFSTESIIIYKVNVKALFMESVQDVDIQ